MARLLCLFSICPFRKTGRRRLRIARLTVNATDTDTGFVSSQLNLMFNLSVLLPDVILSLRTFSSKDNVPTLYAFDFSALA